MPDRASPSPIEQVAEVARESLAGLESLRAENVALRGRVEALERHLEAAQAAGLRTAERLERLGVELDRGQEIGGIAAQIQALREAHTRSEGRIEQIASERMRIDRLESSLAHLRDELLQQAETRDKALRAEFATWSQQQLEHARQVARELQAQATRIGDLERLPEQVKALRGGLDGAHLEIARAQAELEARAVTAARQEEGLRLAAQQAAAEVARLDAAVLALGQRADVWGGRIEAQDEAVRAARGVADLMQEEVGRIRQAHSAVLEAARVFEGRVETLLADARTDSDARWSRFLTERAGDWSELRREIGSALEALRGTIAELREGAAQERAAIEAAQQAGFEALARDHAELQVQTAAFLRRLQTLAEDMAGAVGAEPPSGDPTAVSAERRQALRRALRAGRGSPGGGA